MATRLNKKFIFIVTAIVLLLAVCVAGVAYVAISGDAARQVALGKQAEAEGKLGDAMSRYGRAIGKDPRNLEYYDLFENVLLQVVPATQVEAVERYNNQYLQLLERRKSASIDNPVSWKHLVDVHRQRALVIDPRNDMGVWADVQDHADRMASQFEYAEDTEGEAASQYARAIRLQAMSKRSSLLKPDEERLFAEDAAELRESDPSNPILWDAILRMALARAEEYAARGDDRRLESELFDEEDGFDAMYAAMVANNVEPVPSTYGLIVERAAMLPGAFDESSAEVRGVVQERIGELVAAILVEQDQDLRAEQQNELRSYLQANLTEMEQSVELLEPLVDGDLLPLDVYMTISQNFVLGQPEFVKKVAQTTLETDPLPVSLQAMMQKEARCEAALALFDTHYFDATDAFGAAEESGEEFDGTEMIAQLRELQELVLAEFQGDERQPAVKLYTDGSISLIEEDPLLARTQLLEAVETPYFERTMMQLRILPRLISAASSSGESGAALRQLQSFVDSLGPKQGIPLRVSIARQLLRFGRLDDAQAELDRVLGLDAENEAALELTNEIRARSNSDRELASGPQSASGRIYGRIRSALTEDRLEDARRLLVLAIGEDQDPAYYRLLVLVLIELGEEDEARRVAADFQKDGEDIYIQRALARIDVDDPLERIEMLASMDSEDPASQTATQYLLIHNLARSSREGHEQAREMYDSAFQKVLATIPRDRSMQQRLLSAALAWDTQGAVGNAETTYTAQLIQKIEEVESDEVQLANLRAIASSVTSTPQETLDILQPVIDRGIANGESWFIRGLALRELGRLQEAVTSLANALEQAPDNVRYLRMYAAGLEQTGEPQRSLELFRRARKSDSVSFGVEDVWLTAEAAYGDKAVATRYRLKMFQDDISASTNKAKPIFRVQNALDLAALLLVVKPERIDILDRRGEPKFSPVAWSRMSSAERRKVIGSERAERSRLAFEIYDAVESIARGDEQKNLARIARADGYLAANEPDTALKTVNELLSCCDDQLTPTQRLEVIQILGRLMEADAVNVQYAKLAQSEDSDVLRSSLTNSLNDPLSTSSLILADALANVADEPRDKVQFIQALVDVAETDRAKAELEQLYQNETVLAQEDLRYRLLLIEAELESVMADAVFREADEMAQQVGDLTSGLGQVEKESLIDQAKALRAEGVVHIEKVESIAKEAALIQPRDPAPLLYLHRALRSKRLLLNDAAAEADLYANARRVRDLSPMEWRTNRAVVQAYIIKGQPIDALGVIEQYIRRGGLNDEARETMFSLAMSEGNPGMAIPGLTFAMERDPGNPVWPRTIAILLIESGDVDGASDMWWKVLEVDSSPEAVDAFVDLEFRRSNPNLKRLREALQLISGTESDRPEMRAAYAVVVGREGATRQGDVIMRDAYNSALKEVESGADPIVIDRVLAYFFKLREDEELNDAEARLRQLTGGNLGAHEYGGLASKSMQIKSGSRDLESAKRYLRSAADQADGEDDYKRALLHQLSTVLYVTQDCDGAIRALEEVVSLSTLDPATMNNLAYMLVECRNDPEAGLVYSTQAIRIDANNASYLDTHGYILFKLGQLEDAELFLSRAVAIGPSPSNLIHLAQLMHATGRNDRAQILIEKIGKDFPSVSASQQEQINELISSLG